MRLLFIGANHTVTGSRYILEINGKKIMLDCGMHQGKRAESEFRNRCFPIPAEKVDMMLLSHAHIDHSGNIPLFVKKGFKGPIYSTLATQDLCQYMLLDSAFIQEKNIEYLNKKRAERDEPPVEPLYGVEDANEALTLFKGKNYYEPFEIAPGVKVTFYDAGHILGSALTYLELKDFDSGESTTLLFTGDLGRPHLPILRNPDLEKLPPVDVLMIESTYGDKFHESAVEAAETLATIIKDTASKGGKIIIPAFALGRTQEITYELHQLYKENRIPNLPIFLDSPLAVNVTEVFKRHPECFDEEAKKMIESGDESLLEFDTFKQTTSVEESKALNNYSGPCIIIASSGMCEHGRILHHLKNNIEDPKNSILIVGYQAEETLGRKLVEGMKEVNIYNEPHKVRAKIEVLNYFSAHGDRSDLLEFTSHLGRKGLKRVFLVHGDSKRSIALKDAMESNEIPNVVVPKWGESYDLSPAKLNVLPETRIGFDGAHVYDKDGQLATDNPGQLEDIAIPGSAAHITRLEAAKKTERSNNRRDNRTSKPSSRKRKSR